MMTGLIDVRELQEHGRGRAIGRRVEVYESVTSTNSLALERAAEPDAHGLIILAEHQSAGRGRWNRIWHSPRGASVLCTVLVICEPDSPQAQGMSLWPVLAVRAGICDYTGVVTLIKWPNDLMVGCKKLCGILIESKPVGSALQAYAIGIGINCLQHARHFPPEIAGRATSLDLECSQSINRLALVKALITALDAAYERAACGCQQQLKSEWLQHALPMGERLEVFSEGRRFTGRLIDLDPQEGILVELERGGRRFFSAHTTTIQQAQSTQ